MLRFSLWIWVAAVFPFPDPDHCFLWAGYTGNDDVDDDDWKCIDTLMDAKGYVVLEVTRMEWGYELEMLYKCMCSKN